MYSPLSVVGLGCQRLGLRSNGPPLPSSCLRGRPEENQGAGSEVLVEGEALAGVEKSLRARTGSRLLSSEGGRWAAVRASMTDLLLMALPHQGGPGLA